MLDPKTMNPLSTGNSILRVMNNSNPSTLKYILCLGDSTTDDNYTVTKTLQENLAACSGTTPEFIGTHGKLLGIMKLELEKHSLTMLMV